VAVAQVMAVPQAVKMEEVAAVPQVALEVELRDLQHKETQVD
jgi:hypothetical protein